MGVPYNNNLTPSNSYYPQAGNINALNLANPTLYPVNTVYPYVPTSPNSPTNTINSGLSSITSILNQISGMALPIEKDVGAVSQIYNQVHNMNQTAQIPYVNTAFYQSPQGSLSGSIGGGIGNFFQNMGIGGWVAVLGVLAIVFVVATNKS